MLITNCKLLYLIAFGPTHTWNSSLHGTEYDCRAVYSCSNHAILAIPWRGSPSNSSINSELLGSVDSFDHSIAGDWPRTLCFHIQRLDHILSMYHMETCNLSLFMLCTFRPISEIYGVSFLTYAVRAPNLFRAHSFTVRLRRSSTE